MKKVTIEFDTDGGNYDLRVCLAAPSMHALLSQIDSDIRSKLKYWNTTDDIPAEILELLQSIRSEIGDTINKYELDEG